MKRRTTKAALLGGTCLALVGCQGLAESYRAAMERGGDALVKGAVEADALYCAAYGPEARAGLREAYAALADASPATAGQRRNTDCPDGAASAED